MSLDVSIIGSWTLLAGWIRWNPHTPAQAHRDGRESVDENEEPAAER
jgi:hypothetical protein